MSELVRTHAEQPKKEQNELQTIFVISERQSQVLSLLAQGKSELNIAKDLNSSASSIKSDKEALTKTFGTLPRAVATAVKLRLYSPPLQIVKPPTNREKETLQLLITLDDPSIKNIAKRLAISESTVRIYLTRISNDIGKPNNKLRQTALFTAYHPEAVPATAENTLICVTDDTQITPSHVRTMIAINNLTGTEDRIYLYNLIQEIDKTGRTLHRMGVLALDQAVQQGQRSGVLRISTPQKIIVPC